MEFTACRGKLKGVNIHIGR